MHQGLSDRYIVANILSYCSLRDQFRAKRVCRKWNTDIDISTWPDMYTWLTGKEFPWFMYMLQKYPDKDWDFDGIAQNTSICLDELLTLYPIGSFNAFLLSVNPAITWNNIQSHPEIRQNDFGVSKNPNINAAIIRANPNFKWHTRGVGLNPSICWHEFIQLYPDERLWVYFSGNPNLQLSLLFAHPKQLKLHYDSLSANPNITWEFVLSNLDEPWAWYDLSTNPIVTWDIMQKYPNLPWDYEFLPENPNITWEIVRDNPKWWCACDVSRNPNITYDIVLANPDYPWDWERLSGNPSITWSVVHANMDMPWAWRILSQKSK
jgi:hypothetical protein